MARQHPTPAIVLLARRAATIERETLELNGAIRSLLEGKRVKILDRNFNGQPFGSSKPSLYGKTLIVYDANYWDGRIWLHFENLRGCVEAREVELQY